MKLEQILTGNLEQQIRDGLAKLAEIAPAGTYPRIYVSASANAAHGYVAADIEGVHNLNAFGCESIPAAVDALIAKFGSPEAIERRKNELKHQISKLQAELDAIPAPITVVPEPEPERDEPALHDVSARWDGGLHNRPATEHDCR